MEDLCLHIRELAENSTAAGASLVRITVVEDVPADRLVIEVADNGRGMSRQQVAEIAKPLDEEKTEGGVHLGLPLFIRTCRDAGGDVSLSSEPGLGAVLRGEMRLSHRDRKPLGDPVEAVISLIMGAPGVDWIFVHDKIRASGELRHARVDTEELRRRAGDMPLAHPDVIRRLLHDLREQETKLA